MRLYGVRAAFLSFVCLLVFIAGCGPKYSYPAATVPEAVEKIAKEDYGINVSARVVGKTLGAIFLSTNLVDRKKEAQKEVQEKMQKVLQVVTRVALSTDMPLNFCTVVVRDPKHKMEVYMTRRVDDIRRANAEMLGFEEAFYRLLIGQEQMGKTSGEGMNFVLKDWTLEEFLTEQIVQRARYGLFRNKDPKGKKAGQKPLFHVEGSFRTDKTNREKDRTLRFSILSFKTDNPEQAVKEVFHVASGVLGGYDFKDFDRLDIRDYMARRKLVVDRDTFMEFRQKNLSEEQLFKKCMTESESLQEAFELFGVKSSNEATPLEEVADFLTSQEPESES